jgi:hypothetical protein
VRQPHDMPAYAAPAPPAPRASRLELAGGLSGPAGNLPSGAAALIAGSRSPVPSIPRLPQIVRLPEAARSESRLRDLLMM